MYMQYDTILFFSGVALSNQSCNHAESPAIEDPTVWAFTVGEFDDTSNVTVTTCTQICS